MGVRRALHALDVPGVGCQPLPGRRLGRRRATMTPTKRRTTRTDLISSWCRTAPSGAVPQPGDVVSVGRSTKPSLSGTRRSSPRTPSTRRAMARITLIQENGGAGNDGWVTYPVDAWIVGDDVTGGCTTRRGPFSGRLVGFTRSADFEARVVRRPATPSVCSPAARARSRSPATAGAPRRQRPGLLRLPFPKRRSSRQTSLLAPLGSSPPSEPPRSHLRPPRREHRSLPF